MANRTKEEIIRIYGEDYYYELRKKRNEYSKKYRAKHPDCRKKEYAKLKERNPDEAKERYRKYYDRIKEKRKIFYHSHKEECLQKRLEWSRNNKEKANANRKKWALKNPDYNQKYYKTKKGRAKALITAYKKSDIKKDLLCTLNEQWLIDNVFSGQVCHYCGETDWLKLGCDRIDNLKPHTPDNVIVCCANCNRNRRTTYYGAYMLHHTPQFLTLKENID